MTDGHLASSEQGSATGNESVDVKIGELEKALKTSIETNERILEEHRIDKSKLKEFKLEQDTAEKTRLEESENWKGLLDKERNDRHETSSKLKEMQETLIQQKIGLSVNEFASDAKDLRDIVRLMDPDALEIDVESGTVKGVEAEIERLKKDKPWHFKSKSDINMINKNPNGHPKEKSLSDLPKFGKNSQWKEAVTQMMK